VTVIKYQFDCVIADWLDVDNCYVFFSGLQFGLVGRVAAHFGRRRKNPQVFAAEATLLAIVKADFQFAGLLMQFDFARNRGVWGQARHDSDQITQNAASYQIHCLPAC
jgi:hypothetical protein